MDITDGWQYMADVCVAIVRRYDASSNLSSLKLGEYDPSLPEDFSAGFDVNVYRSNVKLLWQL